MTFAQRSTLSPFFAGWTTGAGFDIHIRRRGCHHGLVIFGSSRPGRAESFESNRVSSVFSSLFTMPRTAALRGRPRCVRLSSSTASAPMTSRVPFLAPRHLTWTARRYCRCRFISQLEPGELSPYFFSSSRKTAGSFGSWQHLRQIAVLQCEISSSAGVAPGLRQILLSAESALGAGAPAELFGLGPGGDRLPHVFFLTPLIARVMIQLLFTHLLSSSSSTTSASMISSSSEEASAAPSAPSAPACCSA